MVDLDSFLTPYRNKKAESDQPKKTTPYTHLRMMKNGKKGKNGETHKVSNPIIQYRVSRKMAGSFFVPKEKLSEFYQVYYEEVFKKKIPEFLVENQDINVGAIMLDFDFHFPTSVTERVYTENHVNAILNGIMEELSEIVEMPESCLIYLFEKERVNCLPTETKDGLHVKVDMALNATGREALRLRLINWFEKNMTDLGLNNSWEGVVDKGIILGKTGWQLYGSRKVNHEPYIWTGTLEYYFPEKELRWVEEDPEFHFEDLPKLIAQTPATHVPKLKEAFLNHPFALPFQKQTRRPETETETETDAPKTRARPEAKAAASRDIAYDKISCEAELDIAIHLFLQSLPETKRHEWYEIKEYLMVLPEGYYAPGSHVNSRKVAFALKDKHKKEGFLFWIKLRSRAHDFQYGDIPSLLQEWVSFNENHPNPVKISSLKYWVEMEAPEDYKRIYESSLSFLFEKIFHTKTRASDYDLAMILYKLYHDKLVCTDKNVWYVLKDHRWKKDETGDVIANYISTTLLQFMDELLKEETRKYLSKKKEEQDEETDADSDAELTEESGLDALPHQKRKMEKKEKGSSIKNIFDNRRKRLSETVELLKNFTPKSRIMSEAQRLFRDSSFYEKLDTNGFLLGFNNGVVDFEKGIFRPGKADDYITFSTGHDYFELTEEHQPMVDMIMDCFRKICPLQNEKGEYAMMEYLLDFLAACLNGVKLYEIFLILYGSGANGKTILDECMKHALGNYYLSLPPTIFSGDPPKPGATCAEVAHLKGVRYASGSESQKGVACNESTIKWLTGGGDIAVRDLNKTIEPFHPQYYLAFQTNNLFRQVATDDGTWRRNKVFPMLAKFYEEGEKFKDNTPYRFPKNEWMKTHFPKLCAPVFINMLVQRAFRTKCKVVDCEEVRQATENYRNEQDVCGSYFQDRLVIVDDATRYLTLAEIRTDYNQWKTSIYQGCKMPNMEAKDLEKYLTLKLGEMDKKRKRWSNIAFVSSIEEEDVEEP